MFSILTTFFYRTFLITIFCILISIAGFSQSLLWSKLSDIHSETASAGIRPNSVIDETGNFIYVSVERDILHFYKLDQNGNELAHLNSEQTTGAFSKLIKLASGDFAIAYDVTPLEIDRSINILTFNSDLDIIQNQEINLPFSSEASILYSIFELEGSIFLSIFDWEKHFILKILEDQDTELIFTGYASFASEEKLTFLDDQSLLIEYQIGTEHLLRRVSIRDKELIWEKEYLNDGRIEMQYKTVLVNDQWIALASAERDWVDGEARDTIRLKKLALSDGSIISDTFLIPDRHCITHLSDFKFNSKSGRFYFSLAGCFPNFNLSIIQTDIDFNFLQTAMYDVNSDELFMHDPTYLHILPDGEMVFVFKSRKDSIERGNLYFTKLKEDLSFGKVLEVNIMPKNSSESISDILTYDDHKILFTGSIPSSELNIFWEEVQFFTMLIDFENTTSSFDLKSTSQTLEVFPNPVRDILNFKFENEIEEVVIFDITGKSVFKSQDPSSNELDIQSLPDGMYFLTVKSTAGQTFTTKFIKGSE